MKSSFVLTDAGFWIGLLDQSDQFNENASSILALIEDHHIVFPWPCVYETLRTKYCKRKDFMIILEKIIKAPNITLFDDSQYRKAALDRTFINIKLNKSFQSLVDNVIREILSDINVKIDYLVTFNERDFSDVCSKRNIPILGN
jgi:hypothetical protein